MTSPEVTEKKVSTFAVDDSALWNPPAGGPPCKSGCHGSKVKPALGSSFSTLDANSPLIWNGTLKGSKIYDDKFLADWIATEKKNATPKPAPTPQKPVEAQLDVTPLVTEAAKLEKLAGTAKSREERIGYYQDAAKLYRLAQKVEEGKKVLGLLRKELEADKNDLGVTQIDAELAFLEGRFGDALKSMRAIEVVVSDPRTKLTVEEREAAKHEINLKISFALQGWAAQEVQNKKWDSAIAHLEEALIRTPSPYLSEKVLALWKMSGKSDLEGIRYTGWKEMRDIATDIARLRNSKTNACNTNCHAPTSSPFDVTADTVLMEMGGGVLQRNLLKNPSDPYNLMLSDPDPLAIPADDANGSGSVNSSVHWGSPASNWKLTEEQQFLLISREGDLHKRHAKMEKDMVEVRAHLAWIVRTGYGEPGATLDSPDNLRRIAQVIAENGDKESAIILYEKAIRQTPPAKADATPEEKAHAVFHKAEVSHELAALYMQTGRYQEAIDLLDTVHKDLEGLDLSQIKFKPGEKDLSLTASETLHLQNRFMKAEVLLAKASTQEELDAAINSLRDLATAPKVDLWNLDPSDPQQALIGRINLRLGQILLGQDPNSVDGNFYLNRVIREFPGDEPDSVYLRSEAMLARGLATLQCPGKTVAGLELLREVQKNFAGSEADLTIRGSHTLASIRGADGMIKADINEADLGEALKVALDRSSEGPGWRKGAFAGGGAILAAVIFWEVSIPVLIIGAGVGYFAEKGVTVYEKRGDILDAYRSGMSNVDGNRHLMNMFMLGLDVAMLVTAGAGGALARQGVRYGMSWGASRMASYAGRSALGAAAWRTMAPIGKGLMYVIPAAADSTVAYSIYKGERSLILGEKFHWDPKEAFLMFAMCEAFAFARYAGTASKFATKSAFNKGVLPVLKDGEVVGFKEASGQLLKPVLKDGKVAHFLDSAGKKYFPVQQGGKTVGATNAAGQVVVWANDLVVGATTYYAMLLGANAMNPGSIPGGIPDYDAFLAEQLKTLGALHLGSKAATRLTNSALENALVKLDKRSTALLKHAKEAIDRAPPWDGGFPGLGPQLAYAGAFPASRLPSHLRSKMLNGPMMMASLEPFEYDLLEKDITVSKNDAKENPEKVTVEIEANKPEDIPAIAEASLKLLPKEVKKVKIVLKKTAGLESLAEIAKVAKQKGLEIEVVREETNGHTEHFPEYRIVDGQIRVLSADKLDANTLSTYMLVAKQKDLDIAFGREVANGKTEFYPSVEYVQTPTGRRLTFKWDGKAAKPANALLAEAAKMEPALFKGLEVEVLSIPFEAGKPLPSELNALVRTALWGSAAQVKVGVKGGITIKAGAPGKFNYSFSTSLDFPQARGLYAEYLGYETARAVGVKGPADAQAAFFAKYFDQAMQHAADYHKHLSSSSNRRQREDAAEYAPYVTGGNWSKNWKSSVQQMLDFASGNRALLLDVMTRIEKYSQPQEGHLMGVNGFDGRALGDNAFELMRIFEVSEKIDPANRAKGLKIFLETIQKALGKTKHLELYGAPIGMFFKVIHSQLVLGKRDHPTANEGFRLEDFIDAVNTQKWPGKYRFTVLPEDRFLGTNPDAKTKTPDLMVEVLSDSGQTEKVITVELTNAQAGKTFGEVKDTVGVKLKQILEHKFAAAENQGDGLIVIKFYQSTGLEQQSVADVQKALNEHYQSADASRSKAIGKVRVMVICESGSSNRTYWLEHIGGGIWKPRTLSNKAIYSPGTLWGEPLKKAMGW